MCKVEIESLQQDFHVAGGSTVGFRHLSLRKNNQDFYRIYESPRIIIGCVCDGCGSSPRSELGAQLGANMIVKAIASNVGFIDVEDDFWGRIKTDVIGKMNTLIDFFPIRNPYLREDLREIALNNLLFTFIGFVVTRRFTTIFSFGDGIFTLNGKVFRIGPFKGNAPPYIGHYFTGEGCGLNRGIKAEKTIPTAEVDSILIGTDGVADLNLAAEKFIPGKEEKVGPLSQFWNEIKYFKNTEAINRRLRVVSETKQKVDWEKQIIKKTIPILDDDTTMIVLKRG